MSAVDGVVARLADAKTGPRTVWLGPAAVKLVASLPRCGGEDWVFPRDLTPSRLYTFWTGVRVEAGLQGLRIHDCRHTWASQGAMNGVGLPTVGWLLGHKHRATPAVYAHPDGATLQDAAAQTVGVTARAMGFKAEAPPMLIDVDMSDGEAKQDETGEPKAQFGPIDPWKVPLREPASRKHEEASRDNQSGTDGKAGATSHVRSQWECWDHLNWV